MPLVRPVRRPPATVVTKLTAPARPRLAPPAGKPAPTKPTGAFAKAKAEARRIELERNKPFDCSVPVGGQLDVYLLDESEPFYRYEHTIGAGPHSKGRTLPCIQDTNEACPVCQKEGKTGAFTMYLTCVVPKETYTKQDDTVVTRYFTKKLFPIKTKMSPKYQRIFEKYKTFRGLVLRLHRDGKMDPKTGSEIEVVRQLSEAEIQAYAKAEKFKGEEGDKIRKANIAKPFDYTKVFPSVTAKELAAMVGARPSTGGIGQEEFGGSEEFGKADEWAVDGDAKDDEIPF